MGWEEVPLDLDLELPPTPVLTRRQEEAGHAAQRKIRWAAYKVQNPLHCDACLAWVHEHWPNGTHAPNRAVLRRTLRGEHTYWCAEHGEAQKDLDGVSRTKR